MTSRGSVGAYLSIIEDALFPKNAVAVTPSDTVDLSYTTKGLWVGTAGTIKVNMSGSGTAVSFLAVANGTWIPGAFTRVYNTDTSADDIVAMW